MAAEQTFESVDKVTVEKVTQKEDKRLPRQTPTREQDDWFVLLDVVPRNVTSQAPGAAMIHPSS